MGCASVCLMTNATNNVRKPVSTRIAPLPHSATTTLRLIGMRLPRRVARSAAGTSPAVDSTHFGIRRHSTVPATASSAVYISAPSEPHSHATPAAIPPKTPPAARPNVVRRELVVTSVIAEGSTRGVTAALSTTNDFDSTSMPSAAG